MHEWSIAESVACTIKDEMERYNLTSLYSVTIKVGELQMIDMEIFLFALKEYISSYGLPLEVENVKIKKEDCLFKCRVCEDEWDLQKVKKEGIDEEAIHFLPEIAHLFIHCPNCGGIDFELVKGRGIWLESLQGEGR